MLAKIREAQEKEEGFTLIELLVVVIIIGILAAIAIPAFLNQRERAWQSELTSTVRNVALEVESAATAANGDYSGITATEVEAFALALQGAADDPVIFQEVTSTATGFTMCAEHVAINDRDGGSVRYDSAAGGLQPFEAGAPCVAPAA